MAAYARELLAASTRRGRDALEEDDELAAARPRARTPGKQRADEEDAGVSPRDPGKRSRAADGTAAMSPGQALAFADWMTRAGRVDRRAEAAIDDEGGALSAAFEFLAEARGGQPLPDALRRRLAAALGAELSSVRVHTDERAARAAAALRARAFTVGEDIYFAAGAYAPTRAEGVELIAHEVAHVVQQRGGPASAAGGAPRRVSRAGDRHEQQADEFSRRFADGIGREGDDPAEAVNRMRAEATPVPVPFQGELERHFGASFAGVEVYAGEAAREACQLVAAGAFAVRNIVALASPSPRRAQLMHELAHVVQMGQAAAPARFATGGLRVGAAGSAVERDAAAAVDHGRVAVAADPDVIHRDPDPTGDELPEGLRTPTERVDAYLDEGPGMAARQPNTPIVFCRPPDDANGETVYYQSTSSRAFTLGEYRAWLQGLPGGASLTGAVVDNDLTTVHGAGHARLVRVGATGRKWGWVDDAGHDSVVALHGEAAAATRASVGSRYEVYCAALRHCTSLTTPPSATFQNSPAQATWDDTGPQPTREGDLSKAREAIRTAVFGCQAYRLTNNEWGQFFTEIVKAPDKFPQKMVGDMFEQIAADDLTKAGISATRVEVVFARDPTIAELNTQQEYITDGLSVEGTSLRIMEMKTGPANPGAIDDEGEYAAGGMLAKAAAYAAILRDRVHATDVPGVAQTGPFDQCIYIFVTKEMAAAWAPKLKQVFEDRGVLDKLVVYPDPECEGVATLTFNPTFEVPLDDLGSTTHHLTNPAIVHPGVTFRAIDLVTAAEGSTELAPGGSVTMDVELAGAVQGQGITTEEITAEGGVGHVENKLEGLESSLGDVLGGAELGGAELVVSARLTDDGVAASIRIPAGPSGIPNLDILEGSEVTVAYGASGELSITGDVQLQLAYPGGAITGQVQIAWANGQWSFTGTATVPEGLIDGLSSFTASVTYDGGRWSIGVDRVEYSKQIGAIALTGTALGVMYDVEAGAFSGLVELEADLGTFGRAGASATLEDNQLTSASFSYDSPELRYPRGSETPAFRGTVDGTITYENGQLSGAIHGTANLDLPALQAVAGEAGLELEIDAAIDAEGHYSGSIALAAGASLQLGKYFEVSELTVTLGEDGAISGGVKIQIVDILYLDEVGIELAVGDDGVRIVEAGGSKEFQKGVTPFWGRLNASYGEDEGLSIGGEISYEIKPGMVATGTLTYESETDEISVEMTVEEISLLDHKDSKPLFRADKQIPIMNAAGIGLYLDLGFTLGFDYAFDLGVKPTITLEGLSLEDFTFDHIQASLELVGDGISATLTGEPRLGIGVFALAPSILRGGGGLTIPIVGKAMIDIPSGTVLSVQYSPEGGITGESTSIGMAMTFGINGSVIPYAELAVLDGMFNPSWEGDALASFEILPPKEIFKLTIDLGGDMTTQEPALPAENQAGEPVAPEAGTVLAETHEAATDEIGAEAPAREPPVAESGAPGPFSLSTLKSQLETLSGAATIKEILEKADQAWTQLGELAGRVIAAFQPFLTTLADRSLEILGGFATQGLDYLPTLVRMIIGDDAYAFIEPVVSGSSAALLVLFETNPPTDLADIVSWASEVMVNAMFGDDSLLQQGYDLLKETGGDLIEGGGDLIEDGGDLIEDGYNYARDKLGI